ncbi:MAG: hypothetical protein U1E73_02045 [Planctomycetota bacterium]
MKPRLPGLVLVLAALAGCTPQTFRAEAGAMFVNGVGRIALQNSSGTLDLSSAAHRLDGDLGLDDISAAPYLRGEWEADANRVRLHGFGFSGNGSGTLAAPYGDIPSGSLVDTSMDFLSIAANYSYAMMRGDWYRLGVGAQLGFTSLDVEARTGALREAVDTTVLTPMPYADLEFFYGPVAFDLNAGIMSADLGDANGRYFDLEATGRWQATDGFDVLGGYRMIVADVAGRASDRDFDADLYFQGWFLSGGVRF